MPNFHNPYNFIPTPRRPEPGGPLGDCGPEGPAQHGRYHADRYSGRFTVRCTARTPLLVPDAVPELDDANSESTHKRYRTRVGSDGRPLLPPSSVRGMLRSAYEAVTNSRFGIFQEHESPLARRMLPGEAKALVPFGVFEQGGELLVVLLPGTSAGPSGIDQRGPQGPLYAAWVPQYATGANRRFSDQPPRGRVSSTAVRVRPEDTLPAHGERVHAIVERRRYERGRLRFSYWSVTDMAKRAADLPQVELNHDRLKVSGWLCVTHQNMDRKHDERLFFYEPNTQLESVVASEANKRQWRELIRNYRSVDHRGSGPDTMEYARWSRHIVGDRSEEELSPGTLGYARVRVLEPHRYEILALYPVSISRELHGDAPLDLLNPSLRPARSLAELSPADRVFGWVSQSGAKTAYRGNLRIGAVRCNTPAEEAIEHFQDGVPLAILGAPKPQQARFYVGRDPDRPAHMRDPEHLEYQQGRGLSLRGRKTYPRQRDLPEDYWEDAERWAARNRNGAHRYQEFRQPEHHGEVRRDDQNRSVLDWIRPGTEFEFDLDISNLSTVELGALLWLLDLPEDHQLRLGGGKPLGFGCVSLSVAASDIRTGSAWREFYRRGAFSGETGELGFDRDDCIRLFKASVIEAYAPEGGAFDAVSFIAAFLRAAAGQPTGLPTHYPRTTTNPNPEGRNYEWFVRNARDNGPNHPLPDILDDDGLPIL